MASPPCHLIAATAYQEDATCRAELSAGIIQDENDYVSTLVKSLRDAWTRQGHQSIAYAARLPQSQERRLGCDAMIALRFYDHAKIALFEAKWPRLQLAAARWDSSIQAVTSNVWTPAWSWPMRTSPIGRPPSSASPS